MIIYICDSYETEKGCVRLSQGCVGESAIDSGCWEIFSGRYAFSATKF